MLYIFRGIFPRIIITKYKGRKAMKKLKLKLDNLKVETFETQSETRELKGTIKGFETFQRTNCGPTCMLRTCESCNVSCRVTCIVAEECIFTTRP